jgi:TolB-like protein/DNA-binding winged helix-turn-helix (wHTH) protein/Tfp pilus assembly protein PilF
VSGDRTSRRVARFGPFEADLSTGELRRDGRAIPLQEKPFHLLAKLLERPGELVTREELQSRLWGDETFVDFDNNLNAAVKKLRDALGDSANRPAYVETLPRRGYRFVAPVETTEAGAEASATAEPAGARRGSRNLALVALLVLAAVAAWVIFGGPTGTVATSGRVLLAVLPFDNLGGEADAYFADGLTEEMITHLGRLQPRRLGVIARLSAMTYRGTDKPLEEIARELNVDYVLQGGVRRSDGRVRITAQLVQASDRSLLWAETYDFEPDEIFEIQSSVAERVARSLAIELLPDDRGVLVRAGTTSTRAYEAFLQGRHQWHTFTYDGYTRAVGYFEQALAADPSYALAHAGIADAYNLLAFTGRMNHAEAFARAASAASAALALDPELSEAHNALAFALLYDDWDFEGAQQSFERAVSIDPCCAMAYHWYAGVLAALERHDEAIAAMERSLELDPVSLSVISDLGWYYLFADRWDEGVVVCRRTLEMSPGYGWARSCLEMGYVRLGRFDDARTLILESGGLDADDRATLEAAEAAVAVQSAYRLRLRATLEAAPNEDALYPLNMAKLHALLDERDEAFRWLERSLAERDPWMVFLAVDPTFDTLHDDPRFAEMARRIGLGR